MKIQNHLRNQIKSYFLNGDMSILYKISFYNSLLTVIMNYLIIVALFYLGNIILSGQFYFYPLLLIIMFLMATRQNALNVQVHEGSHYLLCVNQKLNDIFCNFSSSYLIFYSVEEYRSVHMLHHRFLNTTQDPDLYLYQRNFNLRQILKGFFEDAIGLSAWRRAIASNKNIKFSYTFWKIFINTIILCLLVISFNVLNGIMLYILLWLIPLFCIFPMIIRVRINAEHADVLPSNKKLEMPFISRTSIGGFLERFLFGAQMEFHFEHHIFPSIPYSKLNTLHKILKENDFFKDENSNYLNESYISFWKKSINNKNSIQC